MFNLNNIHPTWKTIFTRSLDCVNREYLERLRRDSTWLPGQDKIFNAFSRPLNQTRYILFGESPYPRSESANGYAFWDGRVKALWSETGLSKTVNRATSLRNFIKMLLVAEGWLQQNNVSQDAIARLDKSPLVQTVDELFNNLLDRGFLLLNASLVLSTESPAKEIRYWHPFIETLLQQLLPYHEEIQLILFGRLAKQINRLQVSQKFRRIESVHPYNIGFMQNRQLLDLFNFLGVLDSKILKKNLESHTIRKVKQI